MEERPSKSRLGPRKDEVLSKRGILRSFEDDSNFRESGAQASGLLDCSLAVPCDRLSMLNHKIGLQRAQALPGWLSC